ncbi:MAG: sugar-binding protein [Armatimonadetes bacterium]|nr:substrate-binding domain-containing protein [Armatimonadota bacterium]MBS1701951.1 sugar-binding protein [Armatimonadota bacterium]MBS1728211.1 sugar-binding protein [Armatimonadota bacterium]
MNKGLFLALLASLAIVGCNSGGTEGTSSSTTANTSADGTTKPAGEVKKLAFVTNNASDFWTIARKGTEQAVKELNGAVSVDFRIPQDGTAAQQKEILDSLVADKVDGIAISCKDPANQKDLLNSVAAKTLLFCQDSDAPDSNRVCYVGTDNVAAGKMAGEELMKALPNGGKVMVFVGSKDAQNAQERYKGLEDAIKGSKIQILDIRTDEADHAKAKTNVADTIVSTPDLAACVGLWSYNGPAIVSAIHDAKKEGQIKVVCFDEEADTLKGVKDGVVSATIVQQPFEFGRQSVLMMSKYLGGDKSVVPADKKVIIETKAITKDNVDDFSAKLKELTGK